MPVCIGIVIGTAIQQWEKQMQIFSLLVGEDRLLVNKYL